MQKFQRPSAFRSLLYSWPVLAGLGVTVFFLGRAAWNAAEKWSFAEDVYEAASAARLRAEQKHDELARQLAELSSPYGLERELRERYGLRTPDEKTVIFVRRPPQDAAPASMTGSTRPWLERLRAWIPTL